MSRLAFRSLRAFVALLALALSALGSPRSAWERCDFWDNDDTQVPAVAANTAVRAITVDHCVTGTSVANGARAIHPELTRSAALVSSADIACPGPRLGSALGARAPDSAA